MPAYAFPLAATRTLEAASAFLIMRFPQAAKRIPLAAPAFPRQNFFILELIGKTFFNRSKIFNFLGKQETDRRSYGHG